MNQPSISIVVLNWNGRDDTLACLESIGKIAYPNFRVIMVDNGSADNSVAAIRTAFPEVELIETGANLGFAGGNNVGIKRALENGADYVFLLNNDTEVDPGMLDAFVAAAKRFPDAGVFSGKIYYHAEPNRIWYAGSQWNAKATHFEQIGKGKLDDDTTYSAVRETDTAIGCAFFMPAERLREIGLLDDDFFLCLEETDWCYRAKEAGYPSIFVPDAKLWHKVSVSFGGENSPLALYFQTRNRLLWARRHAGVIQRLRVHAAALRSLFDKFILPLTGTGHRGPFTPKGWWWTVRSAYRDPRNLAFFLGVRDFWLRRFGDCPPVVRQLAKKATPKVADAAIPASVPGPE
ncbi:MAG: glycosyltransferase family 2 protein [Thiobacillus sp.]|nr:glycosyltransferase family 2 protein [Thiobacillus sp.]